MEIWSAVREAVRLRGSVVRVAADLGVSPDSVERWMTGRSRPRAEAEGAIRQLVVQHGGPSGSRVALDVMQAVDAALREVREALHSHGRLSNRNEALDETAVLLFAHAMGVARDGVGISAASVDRAPGESPAAKLRAYTAQVVAQHLPQSLAHEMGTEDYALRLKPTEDTLAQALIRTFEALPLGRKGDPLCVDVINEAFGRFLADSFQDEKELGQYLTPPEVVEFIVELAVSELTAQERTDLLSADAPERFGLVLDPSCGVGSFLAEFVRTVHAKLAIHALDEGDAHEWPLRAAAALTVGIDKSERMMRLALANLALFGAPAARLHLANALAYSGQDSEVTASLAGKVGLILTNPPFGARFSGDEVTHTKLATTWATRRPASIDSELMFVERYLEWLRPGGQLVAVVPDSILTNKGLFADLRRGIADMVDVLNVVSLPSVTFASAGTTTKTSVLHLRKRESHLANTRSTRFVVSRDLGYAVSTRGSQRAKVASGENDLPELLRALTAKHCAPPAREVPSVTSHDRWDATFHAASDIAGRVDDQAVRIADVAHIGGDRADPRRWDSEHFSYIEISDVDGPNLSVTAKRVRRDEAPSRARVQVRAGDVLVSTVRPERRSIGVVPPWLDGAICTTGFAVLRPKEIDPTLLAAMMRTDAVVEQLMRNNVGIAYPAIEASCLPNVVLPLTADQCNALQPLAERMRAASSAAHAAQEDFSVALAEATTVWLGEIPD